MDLPRPNAARARRRRRVITAGVGLMILALITGALSRMKPAAPTVPRGPLLVDAVRRGSMIRQVRGNGVLLPEEIRWVPALSAGRVERILVLPGATVSADTVLVEHSLRM